MFYSIICLFFATKICLVQQNSIPLRGGIHNLLQQSISFQITFLNTIKNYEKVSLSFGVRLDVVYDSHS